MYFEDGKSASDKVVPVSLWCLLPMWLALVPLFVMGLWWPQVLWEHFQSIAQALEATKLAETMP
jgi:hydrogenase-4 component F